MPPPAAASQIDLLLYVSRSDGSVSREALMRLAGESAMRNRQRDITGALVATGGHYVQVIEGRAISVDLLLARLLEDPRHRDLRVLWRGQSAFRRFGHWALAAGYRIELDAQAAAWHDGAALQTPDLDRVLGQLYASTRD